MRCYCDWYIGRSVSNWHVTPEGAELSFYRWGGRGRGKEFYSRPRLCADVAALALAARRIWARGSYADSPRTITRLVYDRTVDPPRSQLDPERWVVPHEWENAREILARFWYTLAVEHADAAKLPALAKLLDTKPFGM